jgi:nitroimidazol reductase NimA-like FMN-containing flavoprotein (pyridoxamine 5'-phosphate oxidase superfamily)
VSKAVGEGLIAGQSAAAYAAELLRKKQQLPEEECLELLRREPRGVLSVLGDEGYPYGVPINHYYCEEDGRLYFHSGKTGHKIDAIRQMDKASFCVYDSGFRREGEWALNIRSVIVFGRIEMVEDTARIYEIARRLSRKFTDDEAYLAKEMQNAFPRVQTLELVPEHITGKLVNEA